MNRNWNILQINTAFHGLFQATPMIAFKRSKNLQEIIGGHTVKQGKVFKKNLARLNEKSVPCQSQYDIYLMECILCKIQYVGKSETPFNLRQNNHRKDVNNPRAIPASVQSF